MIYYDHLSSSRELGPFGDQHCYNSQYNTGNYFFERYVTLGIVETKHLPNLDILPNEDIGKPFLIS